MFVLFIYSKKEEQALFIFERKIFRRIYGPKYEDGEWKSRTNRELEEFNKGENIVKWIKGQRISWLGHLERMEEDRMPKKDLRPRIGRDETKRKTQEKKERRSGKRSSSAGSEKMERVGDRQGQMERYFSTGQSPQRAVATTEEEELFIYWGLSFNVFYQVDCECKPLLQYNFPLRTCIFYLIMVE